MSFTITEKSYVHDELHCSNVPALTQSLAYLLAKLGPHLWPHFGHDMNIRSWSEDIAEPWRVW